MKTYIAFFIIISFGLCTPLQAQNITHIWANNGEDKVTQEDLRAHNGQDVQNSIWDGTTINLFGARNEMVAFNVILEAPLNSATNISIEFDGLTASDGSTIDHQAASGADLFNWIDREIELFYVRYLQINGLNRFMSGDYDERHLPLRWQREYFDEGYAVDDQCFEDRPAANQHFPDIAVPLELHPNFSIAAGNSQSIWTDIYIPKTAANDTYTGNFIVREDGEPIQSIPVELSVCNFELPDTPSSKTMLVMSYENICNRYSGVLYPNAGTPEASTCEAARDLHFSMAHRHKISLVDNNIDSEYSTADSPRPYWEPILDGSYFTQANGYDGPGVNTGNNVFCIGLYGGWQFLWDGNNQSEVNLHTDNWVNWFSSNAPETEYFLYLVDESSDYAQTEQWAANVENNPGPGGQLPTLATLPLQHRNSVPSVDIVTSAEHVHHPQEMETHLAEIQSQADKKLFYYNGGRPGTGSFATEDDGVALRNIPWVQYKKGIDRWYFWESTYYYNGQGTNTENDLFNVAQTFGGCCGNSCFDGETSPPGTYNYANGDGVLFYPGTDAVFSEDSYDISGPIASLRLKHWRRGIQDVDYLTMATAIDPAATQEIVNNLVPQVLWEYGVEFPSEPDPTSVRAPVSWSDNPDVWENARQQLAEIIGGCSFSPTEPSCDDNIQNGDETGVDCGGSCPPCETTPSCDDGIQNGNETGVDCGGSDCPPCSCQGTEITMSITFDEFPEDISWSLVDANGATIGSGGDYASQDDYSTISFDFCLDNGCYDFTINDSYGDGLCCDWGNGSYSINSGGDILVSGASFSSSEMTNFCLGDAPAPTCFDDIQNGDETGIDCGGSCDPCPDCNDGIQNGDELGVDCGGAFCPPCSSCSDTEIIISITFDNYPEDISWILTDDNNDNGGPIGSGGGYEGQAPGSSVSSNFCLTDGCYNFTIYDSYGDGLCCVWGNGSYSIIRDGSVLLTGGSFASFENKTFCLDEIETFPLNAIERKELIGNNNLAIQKNSENNLHKTKDDESFNLFPNPATDELNIEFIATGSAPIQLSVIDLSGKVLKNQQIMTKLGIHRATLDVSHLSAGIYLLQMVVEGNRLTKKFVVVK